MLTIEEDLLTLPQLRYFVVDAPAYWPYGVGTAGYDGLTSDGDDDEDVAEASDGQAANDDGEDIEQERDDSAAQRSRWPAKVLAIRRKLAAAKHALVAESTADAAPATATGAQADNAAAGDDDEESNKSSTAAASADAAALSEEAIQAKIQQLREEKHGYFNLFKQIISAERERKQQKLGAQPPQPPNSDDVAVGSPANAAGQSAPASPADRVDSTAHTFNGRPSALPSSAPQSPVSRNSVRQNYHHQPPPPPPPPLSHPLRPYSLADAGPQSAPIVTTHETDSFSSSFARHGPAISRLANAADQRRQQQQRSGNSHNSGSDPFTAGWKQQSSSSDEHHRVEFQQHHRNSSASDVRSARDDSMMDPSMSRRSSIANRTGPSFNTANKNSNDPDNYGSRGGGSGISAAVALIDPNNLTRDEFDYRNSRAKSRYLPYVHSRPSLRGGDSATKPAVGGRLHVSPSRRPSSPGLQYQQPAPQQQQQQYPHRRHRGDEGQYPISSGMYRGSRQRPAYSSDNSHSRNAYRPRRPSDEHHHHQQQQSGLAAPSRK